MHSYPTNIPKLNFDISYVVFQLSANFVGPTLTWLWAATNYTNIYRQKGLRDISFRMGPFEREHVSSVKESQMTCMIMNTANQRFSTAQ